MTEMFHCAQSAGLPPGISQPLPGLSAAEKLKAAVCWTLLLNYAQVSLRRHPDQEPKGREQETWYKDNCCKQRHLTYTSVNSFSEVAGEKASRRPITCKNTKSTAKLTTQTTKILKKTAATAFFCRSSFTIISCLTFQSQTQSVFCACLPPDKTKGRETSWLTFSCFMCLSNRSSLYVLLAWIMDWNGRESFFTATFKPIFTSYAELLRRWANI